MCHIIVNVQGKNTSTLEDAGSVFLQMSGISTAATQHNPEDLNPQCIYFLHIYTASWLSLSLMLYIVHINSTVHLFSKTSFTTDLFLSLSSGILCLSHFFSKFSYCNHVSLILISSILKEF